MPPFATTDDLGELLGETLAGAKLAQATIALELATAQIQAWTRQRIEGVTDDEIVLDGTSDWELILPERPVISATVTTICGTAVDADSYRLSGDTLIRPGGWGGPTIASANWPAWDYPSVVAVTYTHGYDPIPDDIRAVTLQMAARMLQNPTGGIRQESIGSYSVSYGGGDAGAVISPADIAILGRYRQRLWSVPIR